MNRQPIRPVCVGDDAVRDSYQQAPFNYRQRIQLMKAQTENRSAVTAFDEITAIQRDIRKSHYRLSKDPDKRFQTGGGSCSIDSGQFSEVGTMHAATWKPREATTHPSGPSVSVSDAVTERVTAAELKETRLGAADSRLESPALKETRLGARDACCRRSAWKPRSWWRRAISKPRTRRGGRRHSLVN